MATGHVSASRMEAPGGGNRPLRPASVLPSLGLTEEMIHSVTHQLGERYSSLRSKRPQSEHLLFCQLYLSPNHNRDDGRASFE